MIMYREHAFTLIELLLVILVMGILSGVVISVVNVSQQQNTANDSVRLTTMQKIATGLESYYSFNNKYPLLATDPTLTTYLRVWPDNTPAGTTYQYYAPADGSSFGVYVTTADGSCYKYRSTDAWGGSIQTCLAANCDWTTSIDGCASAPPPPCGGSGQGCCSTAPICNSGLTCSGGTCSIPPPPCGGGGEQCCSTAPVCKSGLLCKFGTCLNPPGSCIAQGGSCILSTTYCTGSTPASNCSPGYVCCVVGVPF